MSRMMDVRPARTARPLPVKVQGSVKKRAKKVEFDLKLTLPRISATPLRLALAFILIAGIVGPTWDAITTAAKYRLTSATQKIVATTATTLLPQLKFDKSAQAYVFNSGSANVVGQSMQVGGSGYKATFPSDSSKGITIHDNTNDLTLSFTPLDKYLDAKDESGHIVYPADATSTQILYTVKANGVKEDVVLQQPSGDNAVLRYRLDLPNTLEARLLPSGDLGIYSADPALLGNVQTGSTADQQLLSQARQNAKKDHLAFVVPAPIVKEAGHSGANPTAKFSLSGNILTVTADGLTGASYPLSIDPSFVVTSVSSFMYGGNGDDDITYDATNNQIERTHLSGGNATTLTTGSIPQTMITEGVAVYNGFIYALGGRSGGVDLSTVYYAGINSDGSLNTNTCGTGATWCTDTALPQTWRQGAAVAYDGYLYAMGGTWNNGSPSGQVRYVQLNSDGTIASNSGCGSSWCTASNGLPVIKNLEMAQVYNGIIYVLGGQDGGGSSSSGDNYYSVIKPDGSPGPWHSLNTLTTAVFSAASAVFNNTIYVMGGNNYNGSVVNVESTVQYAHIQSDGTLSAWQTTTSLPVPLDDLAGGAGDGYLYTMGGCQSENTLGCQTLDANVRYAPINPDGTIGAWQTAASTIGTARSGQIGAYYQGNLYTIGGCTAWSTVFNCSTTVATVSRNTITTPGLYQTFGTATSMGSSAMWDAAASGYGYLYSVGGCTSSPGTSSACTTPVTTVRVGTIASDGSLTWTTSTPLPAARWLAKAVIANGYLYVAGGCTTSVGTCTGQSSILYAPITLSTGQIGSWSPATATLNSSASQFFSFTTYGNALYVLGGHLPGSATNSDEVDYYTLSSASGDLATRTQTTSLPSGSGTTGSYAFGYSGRLYQVVGGNAMDMITVNTDGSLGATWSPASTTLPNGTGSAAGAASMLYKGYLYLSSNINNYYLPFNSDGTLGSFVTLNSNTKARQFHAIALYDDNVYNYGGCTNMTNFTAGSESCSGSNTVVETTTVNDGGDGTLKTWTATTSLTDPDGNLGSETAGRLTQTSIATKGCLFVLGGSNSSNVTFTAVQSAPINTDGSIGSWTNQNSIPGTNRGAAAAYGNYIYIIGGNSSGPNGLKTVEYAQITSGCTLGSWTPTSPILQNLTDLGVAVYGNHIYIGGGFLQGTGITNQTEYTTINSDGSLAAWTSGSNMSSNHSWSDLVAYGGYLFVVSGCQEASSSVCGGSRDAPHSVESALINSDGSIGTWSNQNDIPFGSALGSAYALNGYLYWVGGRNDQSNVPNTSNLAQFAPILPNGSIGQWQITVTRSSGGYWISGATYNGYFYQLGGVNGTNGTSEVDYTSANAIPRIGHYTRLLDAGNDVIPYKLWLGGTSIGGNPNIDLSTSTSVADSFSTISTGSSVGLGLNSLTGLTATRYSFLRLTLDDSTAAVFTDDTGGSTAISGLIYYFHPAPFNRLRGGSTLGPQGCNFNGGSTCQLDASP